ncbi:uncharacterized protein BCR38DRAFT_450069 [Pseudomassariella vexata]|uniref:Uncharacterized protein n=1 Tax=Pseudomassariella vexata TaxID=1141098 RepID=A0A1Y2DDC7_9PEZI|nr:uncharacterized protein BCR38DRAFT_450069 [Pseudomassariella vexata]ORY57270.1 hypothetical protein BCR38DRAFT_450069 [Pseudomassariella vexata]
MGILAPPACAPGSIPPANVPSGTSIPGNPASAMGSLAPPACAPGSIPPANLPSGTAIPGNPASAMGNAVPPALALSPTAPISTVAGTTGAGTGAAAATIAPVASVGASHPVSIGAPQTGPSGAQINIQGPHQQAGSAGHPNQPPSLPNAPPAIAHNGPDTSANHPGVTVIYQQPIPPPIVLGQPAFPMAHAAVPVSQGPYLLMNPQPTPPMVPPPPPGALSCCQPIRSPFYIGTSHHLTNPPMHVCSHPIGGYPQVYVIPGSCVAVHRW